MNTGQNHNRATSAVSYPSIYLEARCIAIARSFAQFCFETDMRPFSHTQRITLFFFNRGLPMNEWIMLTVSFIYYCSR